MKNGITLIKKEEVIEINKNLEKGRLVNEGGLEFAITKMKSKRLKNKLKKDLASLAGILWFELIVNHPFLDGNKRTATESMLYFLEENKVKLKAKSNNLIYLSLKIANKDTNLEKITSWLEENIEV